MQKTNTYERKKWYAVYTKPRWEKKVHQRLLEKNFETYCPLNKVHRRWTDRLKIVHEPLFKSYLFVRLNDVEKTEVRKVEGVLRFVTTNGKPAVVRDYEIELIRKFLNEYDDVQLTKIELKPNQKVLIKQGLFIAKQAKVIKIKNNQAVIDILSLGYKLTATVKKSILEVLDI